MSYHLLWTSEFWMYQPGSHRRLPSAVLALIFLARRIQPFLSLVDREVEFWIISPLVGHLLFFGGGKTPSSCDDTEIRTHVPTSEGFEPGDWRVETWVDGGHADNYLYFKEKSESI